MKKFLIFMQCICLILATSIVSPSLSNAAEPLTLLRTNGNKIVNANGQQITLRGTNLGGWLMQEGWLSPLGSGEIDPKFITSITATTTNGNQVAQNAIDTYTTNGLVLSNTNTYWQSAYAQNADNMELKIEFNRARTFNRIVVETDPAHTGDYLRGASIWVSTNGISDWHQLTGLKIDESQKNNGIITIDTGEHTEKIIAIRPGRASENGQYWSVGHISICMSDEYTVRNSLIRRFGETTTNQLIATFQNNWITQQDIQNIANMNMNLVRVPVYWMNFAYADGTIRNDANSGFAKLDWLIEQCRSRGIYVLIDFHGAPGGSNGWASSGQAGPIPTELFSGNAATVEWNRRVTLDIWKAIAQRYKNEPVVAAYGLLNEPVLTFSGDAHLEGTKYWFYNEIYKAVRAIDNNHIVVFEEFGDWSIAQNRPERATWTNYMFEKHPYDMNNASKWDAQKNLADSQVSILSNIQSSWNIPLLVGEFCLYYFNDIWDDFLSNLNGAKISWTNWTYKVRGTKYESGGGNWGYYNTYTGQEPDILHHSAATINSIWNNVHTVNYFSVNQPLINIVSQRANGSQNHPYVALNRSGWSVSASHTSTNPNNPAVNMIDGNESTRWSTGVGQASGQRIVINMGQRENFDKIELIAGGDYDYPCAYKVQISSDGVNFTDITLNNVDIGFGRKMVLLPSTPQTAQYVSIQLTGSNPSYWWSISEINILWRNVN